jgi:hypothetical protein
MATTEEIAEVWTMLHANYTYHARQLSEQYGIEKAQDMLDKLLSGIWLPVLADVPAEMLKASALQYVARGNVFFPQVGELREIAFDLMDTAEGRDATPYDGWAEVMRAMRSHSVYDKTAIVWRDPIAGHSLDAIGGMRSVRFCSETSLPVLMSQFVKAYRTLQGRVRDEHRMLPDVKQLVARMSMEHLLGQAERKELDAGAGESSDPTEWNG